MRWKCSKCGAVSPSYFPLGLYLGRVFFVLAIVSVGGLITAAGERSMVVWGFMALLTWTGMEGAYEHELAKRSRLLDWLREHERLEEHDGKV